jgi:hypothetical protein
MAAGAVAAGVVAAGVVVAGALGAFSSAPGDTAPVDLATPVDMAAGVARPSAVVRAGDARIEVLGPTLLRLEYSPSGTFEDAPTVNAVDRRTAVPRYRTSVSGGWLTIRTTRATLRYQVGSGPFTALNTVLRFDDGSTPTTVHPAWEWECPYGQACQAGAATLGGGASLVERQAGFQSTAGYVGNMTSRGARATWSVLGARSGPATVSIRYTNVAAPHSPPGPRTIDLVVDGRRRATLVAGPTDAVRPWGLLTATTALRAGSDTVEAVCGAGDSCGIGLDTLSVAPPGTVAQAAAPTSPLGGWIRGFDTDTYSSVPTCAPGTSGATCANTIEPLHTDGLLDRSGWRLLDDTPSARWTSAGWVEPRPAGGDVEDGYLFAYGRDYAGALRTLATLTGPAPLLARNVFGVWYSDYTPYSSRTIEDAVYPAFRAADVPLDTLSLDTDWKAPNNWDGWEWNGALFPHPGAFVQWAGARGIDVTLNIHSSISVDDPKLGAARAIAPLAESGCTTGLCDVWDWSSAPQAESNFSLQAPLQRQGVAFFWLDWCCDESVVSMPGLTPDSWIGHLYAQDMVNQGRRGFVLARIGSSNGQTEQVYPAGPWSDHTSAIAFTGDAWGTWDTLAQEVALTPDEATIGEPYVSDDIGSYLGPPPQGTEDPPDLYDRWVQFGTFQPILRLHSNDEQRLPWQYPQPVQAITESFLRLREALVPYTYTLASQSHGAGLPMARPLYLDYPDEQAAYGHPGEYLYGPDVLVAPVTAPGAVAPVPLWFPPGRWTDYFTGATFTGPLSTTVSEPLDRMSVFVRSGGIVPEQPSTTGSSSTAHRLILDVFPGSSGAFTLYADSGTGLGYTRGQYRRTTITDSMGSSGASAPAGRAPVRVTIGAGRGHYPGAPASMGYRLELVDLSRPSGVVLDGRALAPLAAPSGALGWSYDAATDTVVIDTPVLPTTRAATVLVSGTASLSRTEPPAT